MHERVQLVVAYKYMKIILKWKKWNKRGGGCSPAKRPLNPKGAASCARHVEDLLSRSVLPAGTKGGDPCAPRGGHVVDYMSRLVSGPRQKVGPFVPPPLPRLPSRDKSLLRAGTIGPFSTSGMRKILPYQIWHPYHTPGISKSYHHSCHQSHTIV
jgi:hypothetical protein